MEEAEIDSTMVLSDLPVSTRNYTIIDNITGKPIDQSAYSLTIDSEVIKKLNKLKQVNEEKSKQAMLKNQYSTQAIAETFTPQDNSVFTPISQGEYIDYRDFSGIEEQPTETVMVEEINQEDPQTIIEDSTKDESITMQTSEVIQSEKLLDRVVARDPSTIPTPEPEVEKEPEPELDYITADKLVGTALEMPADALTNNQNGENVDNSVFTPDMAGATGLDQASKQIININAEKLGPEIKAVREQKPGTEKIRLELTEIKEGKGVAWLAYLLFFIPLLFKGKNRFVRMHASEGLKFNIMEILGAILFLLPNILENFLTIEGTLSTVLTAGSMLGLAIIGGCLIALIPMIIFALCGHTFNIPFITKKRLIKVPLEKN